MENSNLKTDILASAKLRGRIAKVDLLELLHMQATRLLGEEAMLGVAAKDIEDLLSYLAVPADNPWARIAFLVNGNHRLGGKSPLEAIQQGQMEQAIAAAKEYR